MESLLELESSKQFNFILKTNGLRVTIVLKNLNPFFHFNLKKRIIQSSN